MLFSRCRSLIAVAALGCFCSAGFSADAPDHRSERAIAALELADPAQAASLMQTVAAHQADLRSWHAGNDARLKPAWARWAQARNRHDPAQVAAALAAVDAIYASLQLEHDRFLQALAAKLTPEQVGVVEDRLIDDHSELGRYQSTYRVYLQEFPALTEDQKAFVAEHLRLARTQAVDAQSSAEKADIFKRHKDEIEGYLSAQGYDVKNMIRAFGQKLQAGAAP